MNVHQINQLPLAPLRSHDLHKGACGRVLIIAGSRGMSGAAVLAGRAALRGGAGLVSLAIPEGILNIVASMEPSYLTIPMPEDEQGILSSAACDQLQEAIAECTAYAIGPGWGNSNELEEILRYTIKNFTQPFVLDADALNVLSRIDQSIKNPLISSLQQKEWIITPHPGEFSRLTGLSKDEIQSNRIETAVNFAQQWNTVVVLKGANTVITDGEHYAINRTGNHGMATGGTGDVLTGLTVSLLAQGLPGFEAAQLAVYLHGLAGDIAAKELTSRALIASDLPDFLPSAWAEYEKRNTPEAK